MKRSIQTTFRRLVLATGFAGIGVAAYSFLIGEFEPLLMVGGVFLVAAILGNWFKVKDDTVRPPDPEENRRKRRVDQGDKKEMSDIRKAAEVILVGVVFGLVVLAPMLYFSEWVGKGKLLESALVGVFTGGFLCFMLVLMSLGMRDKP